MQSASCVRGLFIIFCHRSGTSHSGVYHRSQMTSLMCGSDVLLPGVECESQVLSVGKMPPLVWYGMADRNRKFG